MRKAIIAGNWKMHNTVDEAVKLVEELIPKVKEAKCEVVVCPPFICLPKIREITEGTNIKVGAQNMYFEEKGAFTGEISPIMLEKLNIDYVIIGHSERRQYFGETDETVNKKIKAAFEHNLIPILCVGETLDEKENDVTEEVVSKQVKLALSGLREDEIEKLVIAYEPIWAIGTGKTATSEEANEVISFIRNTVKNLYGEKAAESIRIQYGGSVKPSTIKEQMSMSDIDGALVGGASLKSDDFSAIVNYK
ncbi:triose-phosphate isomerase [Clostridium cochlearium]|uniref:Triosephosphate isomerase n=1 Tax=Clostridium cochlearium TaxID=1494 RepID=A0A7Y3V795_CLOCO|nr:triose-phosphate isomerase [Clostridium cochlearium]MBE6065763.1 triose-phosphate isomerase [Clostridium cochlearium]MBU5269756.1 triose-phosphate isomerase [Clostridium cochlearium]MCG4571432.1 triose-phosphate isomerase [Clostridium cochlearium]MCG4580563.1 triose-phosphate isomerase [Clostridium cochlearium]MCR1972234.1 triose-phosphate isomerase [Clostridium cochlearium]